MTTRVQKWGNSLALRIPKAVAAEAGLREDGSVEISVVRGAVVVRPVRRTVPTLEELVSRITDRNRHGEWDTGPAVGREAW